MTWVFDAETGLHRCTIGLCVATVWQDKIAGWVARTRCERHGPVQWGFSSLAEAQRWAIGQVASVQAIAARRVC